jgi:hypothetical protein
VELRNRLNLQKEKRAVPKKGEDEGRKIKCFHSQESGHHQKDYENKPICYKCKEEEHMAAECVEFYAKSGELKMYGFAIPDQGFYCIKIPEEDGPFRATCIIQVLRGEASERKLEEEVKNLITKSWDWQVKQMDVKEYIAIFPNMNSLETFSKISEILMSVHGIKVRFLKTKLDPEADEILQTTWIKIYGLHRIACKEEVVNKVATLAREPLVVDELSLIKTGPVRVKLNCRDPSKLRGFAKIFFNKVGHNIHFVSENYKDKAIPRSPHF